MEIGEKDDFIIASFSGDAYRELEELRKLTNRKNIVDVVADALSVQKLIVQLYQEGWKLHLTKNGVRVKVLVYGGIHKKSFLEKFRNK